MMLLKLNYTSIPLSVFFCSSCTLTAWKWLTDSNSIPFHSNDTFSHNYRLIHSKCGHHRRRSRNTNLLTVPRGPIRPTLISVSLALSCSPAEAARSRVSLLHRLVFPFTTELSLVVCWPIPEDDTLQLVHSSRGRDGPILINNGLHCAVSAKEVPSPHGSGTAPQYLTSASEVTGRQYLRSAAQQKLIVPRCRRKTFGCRAFSVASPLVWNVLSDSLRDPELTLDIFTRHLKTYFFTLYYMYRMSSALEIFWKCAI